MVYSMWDMMYGYGGFGVFWMIVFWAAIIWLIVWIVQQLNKNNESSLNLLEKRYVKGEISKRQYQDMKRTLRK